MSFELPADNLSRFSGSFEITRNQPEVEPFLGVILILKSAGVLRVLISRLKQLPQHKSGASGLIPAYIIELPSGRNLTYFNPRMERKANVFGKSKAKKVDEDNLRAADFKMDYCASNAISGRLTFYYGGLLTENLIQATARDVFGLMLIRLEDYYGDRARILFTSHDEVILDCTKDVDPREVEEIMGQDVPWMEGCPFAAEAEESNHYKK